MFQPVHKVHLCVLYVLASTQCTFVSVVCFSQFTMYFCRYRMFQPVLKGHLSVLYVSHKVHLSVLYVSHKVHLSVLYVSACTQGTFGWNCKETCGKCKGGAACDPVTGGCPGECADGYLKPNCSTSKYFSMKN